MIIAADNLQVTNPAIERAMSELNPAPIRNLVKSCLAAGAKMIDINPGPLSRNPEKKMTFLVETVQSVTEVPLLLDTTNPLALEAGLEIVTNPAIINGFSLEASKLKNILPLAAKFEVDIIGYLLYPGSRVPKDETELIEVALGILEEFGKTGLDQNRLILDPVIAPLIWDNGLQHNQAVLSFLEQLPDLFGFPVRTIAGLSNLTAGAASLAPYDKRLWLENTFVPMLAAAGLTIALTNMEHGDTIRRLQSCDLLLQTGIFAWGAVP